MSASKGDSETGNVESDRHRANVKTYFELGIVLIITLIILFALRGLPWSMRATIGITAAAILLWVLEPIPLPLTSLMVIVAIPMLKAGPLETGLAGFSSGATFLIMAGFMMAQGVNSTPLGKRFAYWALVRFGGSIGGVLFGLILIPSVLSFFIPATAVRTTLLLPTVLLIVNTLQLDKNLNTAKLLVLGLSLGANISGVGLIPAAIANVLTADLLRTSLGQTIYYFTWLKMTWPIWLLMIPVTWIVLLKVFPPEVTKIDINYLKDELKKLGGISRQEKKVLVILIITVLLWMTESFHKLPTSIPALISVILMGMPVIGVTNWEELKNINWGTVILMGATLSLAVAINQSGAAEFFAQKILEIPGLQSGLSTPILAILLLSIITQIYHLGVSNVSTVVLTLTPVVLHISVKLGMNPLVAAMTINITALFGFLLVIETLPGVITFTTRIYSSRDMLRVGSILTVISTVILVAVSYIWWPMIGLK